MLYKAIRTNDTIYNLYNTITYLYTYINVYIQNIFNKYYLCIT